MKPARNWTVSYRVWRVALLEQRPTWSGLLNYNRVAISRRSWLCLTERSKAKVPKTDDFRGIFGSFRLGVFRTLDRKLADIMGLLFVALVFLSAFLLIRFAYFTHRAIRYAKSGNFIFLIFLLRLWQFETAKQYILPAGHAYLYQARKSLFWFLATFAIGFAFGLAAAN